MPNQTKPPVFEDHIGLVKSLVSSFDRSCSPQDSEFFPLACMALIKAISTFDPEKSKFSYWATKIIRNDIFSEMKKIRGSRAFVSCSDLDDAVSDDQEGIPLDLAEVLSVPSEKDTPLEQENKRMLRRHYLDGIPMAEIARECGITREYVRQKVRKAIDSIRKSHASLIDNHPFWLFGTFLRHEV